MVKVLKFIKEMGFIKLYDGDENKFQESIENDILYEVTGVSKYFTRNFASNITECNLYTDIYEQEQLGLKQDTGTEGVEEAHFHLHHHPALLHQPRHRQDPHHIQPDRDRHRATVVF